MIVAHAAPKFLTPEGHAEALAATLGDAVMEAREAFGEVILSVRREAIETTLRRLRDEHHYQQLMEIAGADYPDRPERFEVVYMLLSLTANGRIIVKTSTDEATPVPTVTTLWPNAGWLEREVYDMYGVVFAGNADLRRILTDYGFEGHPFRKDFPLTGYQELRWSEAEQRVVYEPVQLAQDLRQFDFLSPWEGGYYALPGDEKANPAKDPTDAVTPTVVRPSTTDTPGQTGAGEPANAKAAEPSRPKP